MNDGPVISGFGASPLSYVEGDQPLLLSAAAVVADADGVGYAMSRVATGLGQPVVIEPVPDNSGRLFVVDRLGKINILDPATGTSELFMDIRGQISVENERGLLGFALAPDFATSGTFYVYLSGLNVANELRRYQVSAQDRDVADLASAETVLIVPQPGGTVHNGGWIGFDPDGMLYISTGDGQVGYLAQDKDSLVGKILRIDVSGDDFTADPTRNYAIPTDNPFAGAAVGADEVWALGLRNPFRISIDEVTGDIYVGDVGENGFEEVNVIPAGVGGLNFGWPSLEGLTEYQGTASPSFTPPTLYYGHGSGPFQGNSITGGFVYHGDIAGLKGKYVFADFYGRIWASSLDDIDNPTELSIASADPLHYALSLDTGTLSLIPAIGKGADGSIYLSDFIDGEIYRIASNDTANYSGGYLSVAVTNFETGEDVIGLNPLGGRITFSNALTGGSKIAVDNVVIGSVLPGYSGDLAAGLRIQLASGATDTRVGTLISALTYTNANTVDPIGTTRTIAYELYDGDGQSGGVARATVSVVVTETLEVEDDVGTVTEGGNTTIDVLANDEIANGQPSGIVRLANQVATVGVGIDIASGARVTLNANGSVTYDTQNAFSYLIDRATAQATGASNDAALDSFTYELAEGGIATVRVTVNGVQSAGDDIRGTSLTEILDTRALSGSYRVAGGLGDDVYLASGRETIIETVGQGFDQIYATDSFILTAGSSIELLGSTDRSSLGPIRLIGNELGQQIFGNNGNNLIDGGGGFDAFYGGLGNDDYLTDGGDVIVELAGEGIDRVFTTQSIMLTAGSEVEILSAADEQGTSNIVLHGNVLAQRIIGNRGNNVIYGGGGGDILIGGIGNDAYVVSDDDLILELSNEGFDRVYSSTDYRLAAGVSVELLGPSDHSGTAALYLSGNELGQQIFGNAGANRIDGGGGQDAFYGGAGDDEYIVDGGDIVIEKAGEGFDTVITSASFILSAGAEVEVIRAASGSTRPLFLQGNELAQRIVGNNGSNVIDGKGGADVLVGGAGNDNYVVDGLDVLIEAAGEGFDMALALSDFTLSAGASVEYLSAANQISVETLNLTGNEFDQTIQGNQGANTISGGGGYDLLYGLGGADTFAFRSPPAEGGFVGLMDFTAGVDKIALDASIFTGLAPGALSASDFSSDGLDRAGSARLIYDPVSRNLYFDSDAAGSGEPIAFAFLGQTASLSAADFLVVPFQPDALGWPVIA